MTEKATRPLLADLLAAVQPHVNRGAAEPSEARLYIRAHFDTLVAARARGISWPQIAAAVAAAGVTAADGSPLAWRTVNSLFHAERYARGDRRRKHRPKAKPAATPPAAPTVPLEDAEDSRPRGAFRAVPSRPKK